MLKHEDETEISETKICYWIYFVTFWNWTPCIYTDSTYIWLCSRHYCATAYIASSGSPSLHNTCVHIVCVRNFIDFTIKKYGKCLYPLYTSAFEHLPHVPIRRTNMQWHNYNFERYIRYALILYTKYRSAYIHSKRWRHKKHHLCDWEFLPFKKNMYIRASSHTSFSRWFVRT